MGTNTNSIKIRIFAGAMTVLYSSPIFGPVHSRRLGISLGINLMPHDGKNCTFDCIYCECGFNHDHVPHTPRPTPHEVHEALQSQLERMRSEGTPPDVLTFAGNGEPTLHPQFAEIVADVVELRNRFFPQAKVSVLSNATQITRPEVFDALLMVDNNILKLDTVSPRYIQRVDRPTSNTYDVEKIIGAMCRFGQRCIIQTMFMQGTYDGHDIDNTTDEYVMPWLDAVRHINPREVMIYTIDRETPATTLRKATHQQLDRIATLLTQNNISCQVSY